MSRMGTHTPYSKKKPQKRSKRNFTPQFSLSLGRWGPCASPTPLSSVCVWGGGRPHLRVCVSPLGGVSPPWGVSPLGGCPHFGELSPRRGAGSMEGAGGDPPVGGRRGGGAEGKGGAGASHRPAALPGEWFPLRRQRWGRSAGGEVPRPAREDADTLTELPAPCMAGGRLPASPRLASPRR